MTFFYRYDFREIFKDVENWQELFLYFWVKQQDIWTDVKSQHKIRVDLKDKLLYEQQGSIWATLRSNFTYWGARYVINKFSINS